MHGDSVEVTPGTIPPKFLTKRAVEITPTSTGESEMLRLKISFSWRRL